MDHAGEEALAAGDAARGDARAAHRLEPEASGSGCAAPGIRERHFSREGAGERVKEPLRRLIRFRQGNLLEAASFDGLRPLDAIFCRNVLIYFSDTAIRKVVENFGRTLAPEGYLMLGHAESLSRITDSFTPIRFPGAMVYQKPPEAAS